MKGEFVKVTVAEDAESEAATAAYVAKTVELPEVATASAAAKTTEVAEAARLAEVVKTVQVAKAEVERSAIDEEEAPQGASIGGGLRAR